MTYYEVITQDSAKMRAVYRAHPELLQGTEEDLKNYCRTDGPVKDGICTPDDLVDKVSTAKVHIAYAEQSETAKPIQKSAVPQFYREGQTSSQSQPTSSNDLSQYDDIFKEPAKTSQPSQSASNKIDIGVEDLADSPDVLLACMQNGVIERGAIVSYLNSIYPNIKGKSTADIVLYIASHPKN